MCKICKFWQMQNFAELCGILHSAKFRPQNFEEICIQIRRSIQKSASKSPKLCRNLHESMHNFKDNCKIMHKNTESAFKSMKLCRNPHPHAICKCEFSHYLPPRIFMLTSHILGFNDPKGSFINDITKVGGGGIQLCDTYLKL